MTPERWRTIGALFHAALERDAPRRAEFLQQASGGDPLLVREVLSLLEAHGRSPAFLESPAWSVAGDLLAGEADGLPAGRSLGPYVIGGELGRGGMGIVYEAEDTRLGRSVALKALPRSVTHEATRRERLVREARAAAALSHPAIATVYALEEIDGDLYIAAELVRGRTLREELADGPLPPDVLLRTLTDIASALRAAHALGIVHRDLKPENVVRRADGQVKVLDFGIARLDLAPGLPTVERLTAEGVPIGTPGYMAPEQLSGADVGSRADVFAFGILAWELATGAHPFGADPAGMTARMGLIMGGAPTTATFTLPELVASARRCLRPLPADRFETVALLAALQALAAGERPSLPGAPRALWWWTFHQATLAIVHAAALVPAWFVRGLIDRPLGNWAFYTLLVLATASVTLRLNLLFTARVHQALLPDQRGRLAPWITGSEATFSAVLLLSAYLLAGAHDGLGAALVVIAVASLLSMVSIEPATTAAAGLARRGISFATPHGSGP